MSHNGKSRKLYPVVEITTRPSKKRDSVGGLSVSTLGTSLSTQLAGPSQLPTSPTSPQRKRRRKEPHVKVTRSPSLRSESGSSIPTNNTSDTPPEIFFNSSSGEIAEEDLVIPTEGYDSDTTDTLDEVPIRLLQQFRIFDSSNRLVPIGELLYSHLNTLWAAGIVTSWTDSELDSPSEGGSESSDTSGMDTLFEQSVKLTKILEFNLHHFLAETNSLDQKMYLRTEFAWYILGVPAMDYHPFFAPFWLQHQCLHRMVSDALSNPRITYSSFLDSLIDWETMELDNTPSALEILGRRLVREDFGADDVRAYILAALPSIYSDVKSIRRVPLIRQVFDSFEADLNISTMPGSPTLRSPKKKSSIKVKPSSKTNRERDILQHKNQTVVTPIVSAIAGNLFQRSLEVAGTSTYNKTDHDVAREIDEIRTQHEADPTTMTWGGAAEMDGYYSSVNMDGADYMVGDVVMVNPGHDANINRVKNAELQATQSVNSYANHLWFYYGRFRNSHQMFHGQWFVHGSKTILQETAHSRSLFLINKCEDNPIASIFSSCTVRMLVPEEDEVPDDEAQTATDFFCRALRVYDLPRGSEVERVLESLPEQHKPCYSCGLKLHEAEKEALRWNNWSFSQYGTIYHLHDFVYLRPSNKNDGLLEVGQVVELKNMRKTIQITIQRYGRYDDLVLSGFVSDTYTTSDRHLVFDERRLYLQCLEPSRDIVNVDDIDGKCYVRYLNDPQEIGEWVEHDDHFYVNEKVEHDDSNSPRLKPLQRSVFKTCASCEAEHAGDLVRTNDSRNRHGPLRGLELFSGAGGLGSGMDLSGVVETKYAVEFSPSAASTYQQNHPHTQVYCQDTNLLLKHAIETHEGKEPRPLLSNFDNGRAYCKPMPQKGEVDIIFGGPPCQSFSGANHRPKADDIRSTLPGNMLSYAEFYNVDYFLLENVKGLLRYPLMSKTSESGHALEGGIKSGVVKFIMRTLIALGYQVRYKILQAGQYGAPQGRLRVIFWGAKRGLHLPDFPTPRYAFPNGVHMWTLPTGDSLPPPSRSKVPGLYHQCAPLRPNTVNDAIGDLVSLNLNTISRNNPHIIIPETTTDINEADHRLHTLGIPCIDAAPLKNSLKHNHYPGFPTAVAYAKLPQNRYQQWLRKNHFGDGHKDTELNLVEGHYNKQYLAHVIEAVVTVPLRPGANHRDLPIRLQPKRGCEKRNSLFYGRLDGNGHFKTAMTNISPNAKHAWLLHPSQKRVVTVRECARAQGFPDCYNFASANHLVVQNQIRQIGNAVPVPLALALGKSLGDALIRNWEENERQGSPAV
ncbi:hypothetical protein BD779DRAFT_1513769 [Infundibulicybe gibba]|nr:hypothetical protein BD779DRAFT_1513769 [Infundibulicybe gibba]